MNIEMKTKLQVNRWIELLRGLAVGLNGFSPSQVRATFLHRSCSSSSGQASQVQQVSTESTALLAARRQIA